jgi:CHASE2 domain-containing sensor protein
MKRIILKGIFVTSFVFAMMFGVSKLTDFKLFQAFDPISVALKEFELTDYVFSKLRDQPKLDTSIVIVNISQASRRELSQALRIISQQKPKVIGIDSFFDCEGGLYDTLNCPQLLDTLGNLMLAAAIQDAGNVVLVSRLLQSDSVANSNLIDVYDSLEYSDPMFSLNAKNAFANLVTGASYQEDVKICKSLVPQIDVKGERHLAFSVMMAMQFDSVKTKKFLARQKEEEVINFKGNINIDEVKIRALREKMLNVSEFNALCYALDWIPFVQGDYRPGFFENKIVIMGYLGDRFGDPAWEDKFFTPLNTKVAGRANPDMFGPVIHANIVAMILDEAYIDEIDVSFQVMIAAIICFLNVLLFYWLDKNFPLLYDALSVIIQLIQILLVSLATVYVFAVFDLKLDLTLTMGAIALIGPCFDIYKGIENIIVKRLTPEPEPVLTTQD